MATVVQAARFLFIHFERSFSLLCCLLFVCLFVFSDMVFPVHHCLLVSSVIVYWGCLSLLCLLDFAYLIFLILSLGCVCVLGGGGGGNSEMGMSWVF